MEVDISNDGDMIYITAKSNPSEKGENEATVLFNGESAAWSYTYETDDNENNDNNVTETENFGDVVVYPNNSASLLGNVSINGVASEAGDVVAIYVGDELRAKREVIVNSGVAWLNAQINVAGGDESISFKVYDASSGKTFAKSGTTATISPGSSIGSAVAPIQIKMDDVAPELKLLGDSRVEIDQRKTYVDAGATAIDNVDGDLSSEIIITGEVNTDVPGVYELKYDVSDKAGNFAVSQYRTIEVIKTTVIQTLSLKSGWNLISFYVEAEDMAPSTVLSPIKNQLKQIKNLSNSYDPSLPFFLNTLSKLNVNDGYWVKVSDDVKLEVEGFVPEGASIEVKEGWNLVGYPRQEGAAPADELKSLGNTVEQIKSLSESYDPSLPFFLNTLGTMVPGEGYWLRVNEDGTWTLGDTTDSGQGRPVAKMGIEKWGTVAVYPNLTATLLAEVTLNGKPVSEGSMVAAFVGEELRGKREVVLSGGKSYGTLNVNLDGTEQVSFRIWEENLGEEFEAADSMSLEIGETYGTATALVQLDGAASSKVEIISLSRAPFGFSFKTDDGRNYEVEASFDLKKWNLLRQIKGTGEEEKFIDVRRAFYPRQYYRVRLEE